MNDNKGAVKLEGAWIAKVQGAPAQWSYVVSPDSSGRRAAFHGSIDVGFLTPFGDDSTSPFIGEVVMTGHDTARFNSVWYGLKKTPSGPIVTTQVVYIGMNSGEIKYVGQGEAVGTSNLAFYLPGADADGDGFPDPGQMPVASRTVTTIDTRLPAPH